MEEFVASQMKAWDQPFKDAIGGYKPEWDIDADPDFKASYALVYLAGNIDDILRYNFRCQIAEKVLFLPYRPTYEERAALKNTNPESPLVTRLLQEAELVADSVHALKAVSYLLADGHYEGEIVVPNVNIRDFLLERTGGLGRYRVLGGELGGGEVAGGAVLPDLIPPELGGGEVAGGEGGGGAILHEPDPILQELGGGKVAGGEGGAGASEPDLRGFDGAGGEGSPEAPPAKKIKVEEKKESDGGMGFRLFASSK